MVQVKSGCSAYPEPVSPSSPRGPGAAAPAPRYRGGLDHFEGRSYRGWHHHVTCISVAHAFLTLERRRPRTRAAA